MKKVTNARVQEDIQANTVDLQPEEHDVVEHVIKSKNLLKIVPSGYYGSNKR